MNARLRCLLTWAFIVWLVPRTLVGQGYAINFQNADYMAHGDFVYCGAPNYGFTDKFTITAWVKWTTDPNSFATSPTNHENEGSYATYVAYGKHNSNDITTDSLQFSLRNAKTGNKFEFVIQTTSGIKTVTSTVGPSNGTWYFLAATYDGSNIRFYVDGTLNKTVSHTGTINTNSAHRLNMGRLPWGYGFFVGQLDEVRIWARALGSDEIIQQQASVATVDGTDLKSYWSFDEGSGTTIDDSGPTNADGVFYTAAVDVHAFTTSSPYTASDYDKTWSTDTWSSSTLKTVSGAGIDETKTIVSNTVSTLTLQNNFVTTPVLDSKEAANDTWLGIQKTGESSQWIVSEAPLAVELTSLSAVGGDRNVMLNWVTATEVDNYGFSVERRSVRVEHSPEFTETFNEEWLAAGFVAGSGTSSTPKRYRFVDQDLAPGRYVYQIVQIDYDGTRTLTQSVEVEVGQTPAQFVLGPNYPNPFNPLTTIRYGLPQVGKVRLAIYDLLGREVAVLVNGEQSGGWKEVEWNASTVPSGVYLYRLSAGEFTQTRRLVLLR